MKILFITSNTGRGLFLLGRELNKLGHQITIAAPRAEHNKFWLWGDFVRLRRIGKFLLPKKIRGDFDKVIALDDAAAKFANRAKMEFIHLDIDFGLDENIWTPNAISVPRQTMVLNEFGIAPHQKMILIISQFGENIEEIINAANEINRDDFAIALFGTSRNARGILKKINGANAKIICTGKYSDLPSLMRASFCVMSATDNHSERMLKCAVSMGRPTIWNKNEFGIRANMQINSDIKSALEKAITLTNEMRKKFELDNLIASRKYTLERTVREFLREIK